MANVTLRLTDKLLARCSHHHRNVRKFSASLACRTRETNLIHRRNKFIVEKEGEDDPDAVRNYVKNHCGYPTGDAKRFPYKRPVIPSWETYKEIPYHYREGANKELLVPHAKKLKVKKYKNYWEERPFYRSRFQRLTNRGKSLIPYDKKMPVITGKHTGPGVVGGSVLAERLAALHLVQPTGYIDRRGNFKPVENMVPEFVVPKLDDFKLKAYVPYRATDINQSKFTARSLYNAFYAEEAKEKFEEETGVKPKIAIKPKQSKLSKWLPGKKAS